MVSALHPALKLQSSTAVGWINITAGAWSSDIASRTNSRLPSVDPASKMHTRAGCPRPRKAARSECHAFRSRCSRLHEFRITASSVAEYGVLEMVTRIRVSPNAPTAGRAARVADTSRGRTALGTPHAIGLKLLVRGPRPDGSGSHLPDLVVTVLNTSGDGLPVLCRLSSVPVCRGT